MGRSSSLRTPCTRIIHQQNSVCWIFVSNASKVGDGLHEVLRIIVNSNFFEVFTAMILCFLILQNTEMLEGVMRRQWVSALRVAAVQPSTMDGFRIFPHSISTRT